MKKTFLFFLIALYSGIAARAQSGSIGIGTTNPHGSAALEIQSSEKGILIPRLTTVQRSAINNAATGLLVFDISTGSFWFKGSNSWVELVDTANTVWKRNGINAYTIATGNTGIGIDTPQYHLHINKVNPAIGFTDADAGQLSGVINGNGNDLTINAARSVFGQNLEGDLLLQSNSGFVVGGKVGIGTTTPVTKLDVSGSIRFSGELNSSSTGTANLAPVAYGKVSDSAVILSGSGNFSVTLNPLSHIYTITVPSMPPNEEAIIIVTPSIRYNGLGFPVTQLLSPFAVKKPGTSTFDVVLWESSLFTPQGVLWDFSFVIYAPLGS